MGYIKHNAIIVTSWGDDIYKAQQKAKECLNKRFEDTVFGRQPERLVSDIIKGLSNGQDSFFFAPDGSKEGWETSDLVDEAREEFLDYLRDSDLHCDYIEVRFGGDNEHTDVVRTNDSDLEETY